MLMHRKVVGKTDQESQKQKEAQKLSTFYHVIILVAALFTHVAAEKMLTRRSFVRATTVRPFVYACRCLTCKALVYSATGRPSEEVK